MRGRKKTTGLSHNKNSKTYRSACRQQAQQQSVTYDSNGEQKNIENFFKKPRVDNVVKFLEVLIEHFRSEFH